MLGRALGHHSIKKRHMCGQVGSRCRQWRSRYAFASEKKVRSPEKLRTGTRNARAERLHQDRLARVGPQPVVEQNDHAEGDRATVERGRGVPTDFLRFKHDAVECNEADYLYNEQPAPSLRVAPTQAVESEIHTKTYGSINHGVSANARAITTDVIRASITATCHARALRMDIIGPAPARSQTITAPS